ncbi:hypothetical protein CFBP5877_24590 [Agrobacterium tumefaciens]|uniref:Uncharacterized protein n=1 Tax=Agrobacterium tumefaciens TaxID=358 RepID=A0AAE6EH84_AGRTU|nr:hypothetical protein CFBP5499_25340 [Agrobacterium tumefaciens]QCL82219.1 hypothetical protein CFBP5877_24590 [Agrobacterium tumefaciens]
MRSQASVIRSTFLSVSALISQRLGDLSYPAVRSIILSVRIISISQQNQVRAAPASVNELCCKCLANPRRVVDGSIPIKAMQGP